VSAIDVLLNIAAQVSTCEKCALHFSRKMAVPGEGPANARFMFIGEGPGFYENEQGRPFVGQAGKFLDELLETASLKREEVFICNVVKCRPPGNRDPLPDELGACNGYLDQQIAAINPEVIVTLGRYSMAKFLVNARISDVHGKARVIQDRVIVPMFHPAAALHQPSLKPQIISDFLLLPKALEQVKKDDSRPVIIETPKEEPPAEPEEGPAEQLSLF
jgi:uracil-DNA glycosylase